MSKPAFFTDEDVYAAIGMRKAGLDAVSTPEAGRLGESDDSQLAWAAGQARVLVTFNVAHFSALHSAWIRTGRHHAGIVVSSQRPIGDTLRRLIQLARTLDADLSARYRRIHRDVSGRYTSFPKNTGGAPKVRPAGRMRTCGPPWKRWFAAPAWNLGPACGIRCGRVAKRTWPDNSRWRDERESNGTLVAALAKAHRWQEQLESGEYVSLEDLATANGVDRTYVGRFLRLTSLAPEIVERILEGDEPEGISLRRLQKGVPVAWTDQVWC